MTHALVTVMVELDQKAHIEERVSVMMAPFDENIEVEPYDVDCWCCTNSHIKEDGVHCYCRRGDHCDECNDTRVVKTNYNPRSKWDYYRPIEDSWHFVPMEESPTLVTYSLLLPDEGWFSRGELGWFGSSLDEKGDWDDRFKEAYTKYLSEGHIPVVLDYHI